MSKYWLVKEEGNWADEFDLSGFSIFIAENKEEVENQVVGNEEFPRELYFGTNESQEYETREDLLNDISIEEITEEEYNLLEKLFDGKFGVTAIL